MSAAMEETSEMIKKMTGLKSDKKNFVLRYFQNRLKFLNEFYSELIKIIIVIR